MSAKEFWEDNPDLFWAYRFSYIKQKEQKQKEDNYNAWLHGAYIYEALSVSLSNAFTNVKTSYRDKPFGTSEIIEEKTKQNQIEIRLRNRVAKVQELFRGANEK